MLAVFRARLQEKRDAYQLYSAIVQLSRAPALYARCRVPDTLDGRFDSIVLHLHLYRQRLKQDASASLLRYLSEALIDDMDRSLREMGVGDMGVGKRVKRMGSALLGRMKAYEEAQNPSQLALALSRNVYRTDTAQGHEHAADLAEYVAALRAALDRLPTNALLAGELPSVMSPQLTVAA